MTTPVLEVRNLKRDYVVSSGFFRPAKVLHAVKGVNFSLQKGKTLAVVGESGCGKSTLARMITLIDEATAGEILIDGIPASAAHVTRELRQKVQIVFQNPYGSLNPRQKIGDVLCEPLLLNTNMSAAERREKAMAMLTKVVSLSQEEQNTLTAWSAPGAWNRDLGRQEPPPGRGKFLIKVGNRPGIPVAVRLTSSELSLGNSNRRWADASRQTTDVS